MKARHLPLLARPYIVRELPAWGRLLKLLDIAGFDNVNPRWRDAPTVIMSGKLHGYRMELDLKDDLERSTYFLGRYYDLENQLLFDTLLKPGDTFIDVGANIGMTTLHAARRVGSGGRVISIEPQPVCCKKIRRNIELNDIRHVQLHNVGLADKDGELMLKILGGGTICACFSEKDGDQNVREEIRVPVRRGDDLMQGQIVGNLTLKIDVEGYELHVLRGLSETIESHRPFVITEVIPHNLRRAGTHEHQLFDFLESRGYRAYEITLKKRRTFGSSYCRLSPIDRFSEAVKYNGELDVLWLLKSHSLREGLIRLDA